MPSFEEEDLVSDPVDDLKRELLAAAARRQGQAPVGRRRLRGHAAGHRLPLAAATLTIAAVPALLLTSPWGTSPGFLEQAEAALRAPAGTILHVKWELTSTSTEPACTVSHDAGEVWVDQAPPHRYRALMSTRPLDAACSSGSVEELGGTFDSGETLTFRPPNTLDSTRTRFSHPVDPVADLRESISAGTAHAEGRTEVDGRTVERIRIDPESTCAFPACPREPFYWYVDPKTFHPVAAEGAGVAGPVDEASPIHVVVRYLAYEYLPRTAANLALTDIQAQHPNATESG